MASEVQLRALEEEYDNDDDDEEESSDEELITVPSKNEESNNNNEEASNEEQNPTDSEETEDEDDKEEEEDEDTRNEEETEAAQNEAFAAAIEETVVIPPPKPKSPPRMRIKLKLPTQANFKKMKLLEASAATDHDADDTVQAMVVDSDEAVDAVAVPTSPREQQQQRRPSPTTSAKRPKLFKKALPISKTATGTGSRRRPVLPSKQVKLPPIASPGLLVQGKTTPQSVFESTVAASGYTYAQRSSDPHRGSSVTRTVGDLFDTNVKLSLKKVKLVDDDIWNAKRKENDKLVRDVLLERIKSSSSSKKRPYSFSNMVPVSLTIPYPESYIQKRLEYIDMVEQREQKIVEYQEQQEIMDGQETTSEEGQPGTSQQQQQQRVTIPPIPEPPEPPRLSELNFDTDEPPYYANAESSKHPVHIYKAELVPHLDPDCFHITDGRYFGLTCNALSDPNFVGPNAPGVASNNTVPSGLATSTTSTTTSTSGLSGGGMTMILSVGFHSAAAVPPSTKEQQPVVEQPKSKSTPESTTASSPKEQETDVVVEATPVNSNSGGKTNTLIVKTVSSSASSSSSAKVNIALKSIMEGDDPERIAHFRTILIRTAIYNCRTQTTNDDTFVVDDTTYPDLGRAFSSYAGLKPCTRCKSNKQGVFHCRIRRRHKDEDFDGGKNSMEQLQPYFDAPLESLLEIGT